MGRSKFPGKPSKSINRKRVSVLQIEQHEETAAATTKPQVTVEEEDNFTAPATASSATAAKNNNKHGRNNDDDDEDDDGGKNGCSGGQTKSGGNNTTNGGSSGSNSNTNNSNNKKENGNSDGSSNGQKNGNSGNTDSIAISDQMTKDQIHSNCNVDTEKTANNNNVEAHDDVDVEDDDDDDKSDEDDSENVEKNNDNMDKKSSITLGGLNCNKLKKPNKKFKNLNILKPEVMLPSSSRQKANGDFNCLSPTIPMNNPFAIDENISKSKSCSEELLKKSDNQSSSESKSDETIMNADTTITPTNADAITVSSNNSDVPTNTMTTESSIATKPKKSVTFKNILETSDDKSAIKKFYNPNYRIPLVSIIKKECMNRPQTSLRSGECIVRPSRLDEIVKNKNNIDKLDSLKFRPSLLSSSALSSASKTFSISSISHAFASKEVSGVRFRETNEEESDTEEPDVEAEAGFKAANKDRSEHENSTADYDEDAECDDEQQMIVDRHFILPKRSTRSSRLIKPNKRLVEDGIICKKSANLTKTKSNANTSTTATTTTTYMLLAPKKETQRNYFGLGNYYETNNVVEGLKLLNSPKGPNNFTEIKPNLSVLTTALNKTAATINTTTTSTASGNNTFGTFGSLKSNSNFVLRQPRLQFESQNEHSTCTSTTALTSQKPIFAVSTLASTTTCSNSSMMGNLNCIVCDSNIHSKNMQQARKYGGLSCAICRKFISKITKKSIAASAGPTVKALQLHCKNDGICCIQPSVKSHSKNFKKTYKERCAACWLNKCLQNLQFSTGHKQRLNDVLTTIKSSNTTDSKCLVHLNTTTDLKLTPVVENESVSMACLKKDPGLLSPTAALTTSANKFSANSNNTIQKWKTAEGLKLNLKSNPLADNVTFGSTPLLRPGVLEKPLFLTSSNNNAIFTVPSDKTTSKEKLNTISAEPQFIQSDINTESKHTSKNKRKHKEKEKSKDKERDKDKNKDKDNEQKLPMSSTAETMVTNNATEAKEVEKVYTLTSKENDISDKNIAACSQEVTTAIAVEVTNTGETSNTTSEAAAINNVVTVADMNKRQRIDLKGPRVKHVCRSASIVLGQPLALFGEDGEIEESSAFEAVQLDDDITTLTQQIAEASSAIKSPTTDKNDNCSTYKEPEIPEKENKIIEVIKNTSDIVGFGTNVPTITTVTTQTATPETITVSNKQQKNSTSNLKPTNLKSTLPLVLMKNPKGYNINTNTSTTTTTHISKKYMRHLSYNNNIETVQQQLRRKDVASAENAVSLNNYKTKTLISIDFWENYDPAEVCQTGFGLIVTEPVAQRALCFLCGSTGLDPLLFCACCCEPYHQYCVLDEYNLKHSSLDDTMASLMLDSSTLTNGVNTNNDSLQLITQRLNWLCPRCTVCYTCNMSSGSKVKCQKCQKNYHSTCLGTSKRLLGADRPLICVNCLKCKSCSTTKVSKFVGNLPLCMACFKLRKRGNFCPICQKCYDDNDSDPKTMECGDCNQWVHSKCEGLSDEQYNLLSTLPETIEFICKKCAKRNEHSKQRAQEWRQVVTEEFKSSLMSVLKLLSKSHQACALLKLSPRKKVNCSCSSPMNNSNGNGRIQPKALLFNTSERDPLGSDGESQCSEDIYEFSESQPVMMQLNTVSTKQKQNLKCNCVAFNTEQSRTNTNSYYNTTTESMQQTHQTQPLSLVDIKKKISNNLYTSLAEFNYDMNNVIQQASCDELIITYKEILSEQFPWFQNETKACTDALEEDMFESCSSSYGMNVGGVGGSAASNSNYIAGASNTADLDNNNRPADLPPGLEDIVFSYKSRQDARVCLFCRKTGEGISNEESRLLYCGQDCWVHTNCAMWSAEVFEEIDGSLQNVHSAVSRGRMIKCTVCGNRGATVGCNIKSCGEHYHYPCARSINCAFLTDKTMYCPTHARDGIARNITSPNIAVETNFEVVRPVYVELDRRRKKLIDPARVKFHIGSLEVKQLGTVFPRFSDSFEAIIPINFLCSRLYWSCKQPWKIVEYTVRTIIQNSYSTLTTNDMGRNFTVDHSSTNGSLVQLGLAQIARWHSSLSRGDLIETENVSNLCEYATGARGTSTFAKILPDYMPHTQSSLLTSNATNATTDENTEEEPQTNADLLPPDLKDAIFEDLPHELLDGISMLDIFPKFMNYEDLGNASDCKSEAFLNEQSKDAVSITTTATAAGTTPSSNMSDNDDTMNSAFSKQLELSNSWSSSSTTNSISVNHVEDAMLGAARCQFKRSLSADCHKADNLLRRVGGSSISAAAAAIKRRRLSKTSAECVALSLSQQQRLKKEKLTAVALARRQSQANDADYLGPQRTKTFTWSAAKRYMETETTDNSPELNGIKLMQVDGVDDSITEFRIINGEAQLNGTVKCERCQCTYRNYESFQRHLANCEPLSTSESDSERAPSSSPSDNVSTTHTAATLLSADGINGEFSKLTRTATLSNGVSTTTASLPFLQAFQQATNTSIPIGGVQTTANIGGIPIASMQTQQAAGMQNFQGLQNLQNLQFQNFQPQTIGGGNFFISQAAPTTSTPNGVVVSGADDLQFFSNALQSLTANLNGTYTLAPTTTSFAMQPQTAAAAQPQLIAISTNADGTQQFIQLPTATTTLQNPQFIQTSSNGFPTLQATNVGEKKFVMPLANKQFQGSNKLNSKTGVPPTVATAAAKQKLKANGSMKHIQTKIAPNTTTNGPQITVLNASNGISSAQVINQSLLQQLQAAANAQQQPLLFQAGTANQQTPIIMQQPTQNIISFVTPDGAQYVSIPTNDFKAQPTPTASYITASPAAASGTTYLQTDASGNLVLTTSPTNTTTNGHLQMLSATALNQPAQVIGTLIQPQTLQLNGNVLTATSDGQQPVIIGGTTTGTGGTTGLEMISAANGTTPQVILATQPMYYGLETIVQNTVMSSQQFVSTAMPGVLSQNASFSATTTQVFQASKIEPLVDIPAGYVVLNNVDTNQSTTTQQPTTHSFLNATNILQQPSNSEQQQTNNLETIYRLQQQSQASNDKSTTSTTTYQFGTTPPIQQHQSQIITAKIQPVITQAKQRSNNNALIAKSVNNINATKVQPQVVNKVLPTSIAHQQQLQNKVSNIQKQTKASITPQPQQQAQPSNIFMRPTIATLPVSVATTNEPQHNLVTQPNKTSTSRYETSLINSQAQQIYTTPVQPMNATLTITTTTTQPTVSTVSSKPFTQTANMRKSNPIRPINKVEVKPKVLKTNLNATSSSTNTYAKTTTSKLKTQESSIMSTSHSNNATPTTQQTPQFSIITIAHPIDITEQQHSVSLKQQPQQTATIVYDQQQQPIVEYQINEQIPQNNIAETFKHQQQQRHHEILALHMPNPNSNNTNTNNNRLQLSNTNNVYNSNVPTNVVNPIQFTTSSHSNVHTTTTTTTTTTLTSRPTNRVLPMQQKQQQDHNKTNNIYCSINSNTHNNNKQMQQTTTTTTTKCYASPTASLKSCFEADLTKKVEETTLEQFLQSEQTENQLQPETIQIMHVQQPQQQQQHEDVQLSSALSFELKNGELEMQQTSNSQLEQAVNNLPDYENTNGDNNDCLLDEKQRKKLIAAAYALNSDTNNAINDEVISNVANDVNVGEDDDDGFSLKMPTDDDGDMDLDHEISDSDEPAVKAKISRILDNLTNDDCNDSIATATTIEANAAMNIQPIRFMQTEICDSTTNKNLSKSKELTLNHKSTTMYDDKTVNSNNNVDTASFIQQMATQTDYVTEASEVLKKLKCELPSQPSIEVETEIKETIKHKEIPMTNETAEASVTTPTTFQTSQHMHPTPHFTPKDPKKITGPHLLYEIQSEDGFTYKSTSITEIWEKVFEAVQVARNAQGLAPLPEGPLADMSGVQMIGLKTNALKYLIEQLPGVEKCSKYTPKFHKRTSTTSDLSSAASGSGSSVSTASCEAGSTCSPLDYSSDQEDIQENPYYCARCEPYRYRSEYDMFSWLASRHRKQPIQVFVQPSDTEVVARRGTGSNLPMAMKYRTLKETYKDYVGVFRSHIHGRGLYCTKDIEAGEMVIEYAGELIRSTLTDKRERNYNSRGIGCYMFKIDENLVVDATMRGNAARFINHSCEPNCYSKVVDILGHKHIIIFALRRIVQGEELTYDYKFPFEEEKIPCSCGSKKCRKYLN